MSPFSSSSSSYYSFFFLLLLLFFWHYNPTLSLVPTPGHSRLLCPWRYCCYVPDDIARVSILAALNCYHFVSAFILWSVVGSYFCRIQLETVLTGFITSSVLRYPNHYILCACNNIFSFINSCRSLLLLILHPSLQINWSKCLPSYLSFKN
jgi:hypothetical protein